MLTLTEIGPFGLLRKARTNIPAHLHTGIDIKRPSDNHVDEPVFSIADGIVISKREDGPYAQLIIAHELNDKLIWSVYEHIAGIELDLYDEVDVDEPIARFMNREELNRYGWQFDHFHIEILKVPPLRLQYDPNLSQRLYASYSLICYDDEDLHRYYLDPMVFFKEMMRK